jgi:hypothetical protein
MLEKSFSNFFPKFTTASIDIRFTNDQRNIKIVDHFWTQYYGSIFIVSVIHQHGKGKD